VNDSNITVFPTITKPMLAGPAHQPDLKLAIKYFFIGTTCGLAIIVLLYSFVGLVFAAPPTQRVQEATIGQQDRTLGVDWDEYEGYDNSDFLRDMDAIARGTYIEPMEADSEEVGDE
jgi:hypothetical protein